MFPAMGSPAWQRREGRQNKRTSCATKREMRTAFANRRTLAPSRDPTARGACLVDGQPYAAAQRVYADAVGGGSQRSPTDAAPQTGCRAFEMVQGARKTRVRALERRFRRRAGHSLLVAFVGSLSGGGATLQAGINQFSWRTCNHTWPCGQQIGPMI